MLCLWLIKQRPTRQSCKTSQQLLETKRVHWKLAIDILPALECIGLCCWSISVSKYLVECYGKSNAAPGGPLLRPTWQFLFMHMPPLTCIPCFSSMLELKVVVAGLWESHTETLDRSRPVCLQQGCSIIFLQTTLGYLLCSSLSVFSIWA